MLGKHVYDPSGKLSSWQSILHSETTVRYCSRQCFLFYLCCPTAVDHIIAWHLTSPIFISHKMQKPLAHAGRKNSYSDNVILAFKLYYALTILPTCRLVASVRTYIAVSPLHVTSTWHYVYRYVPPYIGQSWIDHYSPFSSKMVHWW